MISCPVEGLSEARPLVPEVPEIAEGYGELPGAFYGVKAIPEAWMAKLARKDILENFSERLLKLSEGI